jgi:aminomethyltransferase
MDPTAAADSAPPRLSPLAKEHARLGAKFAPFAGWEMPIQYAGIIPEHRAVRENCGVFDISHMGQIWISGDGAAGWLNGLLTNDMSLIGVGEGQYTLMLNEDGGVIDDLILYRTGETEYFLVVNASKIAEDASWLAERLAPGIQMTDESDDFGGLAIQGPDAAAVWAAMSGGETALPPRNGIVEVRGSLICRTGYTGEDGFELFSPVEEIAEWFGRALEAGAVPCGLGARDTLRLEKCYPLNGSDARDTLRLEKCLNGSISMPVTRIEAGLGFFVKLDKPGGFIGRDVLARQKVDGPAVKLSAIRQTDKGPPPRHDYPVFAPGGAEPVATLSSGSLSPTLGTGIGLAYLPVALAKPGTALEIEVRGRRFAAEVVKKPFV